MAKKKSAALTPMMKRFVQEYIKDLNGKAAYIRAGYKARGNSAEASASALLRNPKVKAAVQKEMDKRAERTHVDQDRVVLELARIAFSNLSQFCTWGPSGVNLFESTVIDPDIIGCVQEVSETPSKYGDTIKFKLHDKCPALKMLGQHLGMFTEKVDLTITDKAERLAKLLGVKVEELPE